jgi:uncharacterized protein YkwD
MVSSLLAFGRPRLAALTLVAILAAAIAVPAAAAATSTGATTSDDTAAISAAETAMVSALNADRTAHGLVAVRVDARLMAIARARSNDMVAKGYFSHTQPDGRNVFDILTAQHISWYNAGEIIAWNNYPMDSTVSAANRQWLGSPGHYAILMSSGYNYVGVGLAVNPTTGVKMWTAVYIKGPDRTAAKATAYTPQVASGPTVSTRKVKLVWTGYDPRLQVLTAGLRSYYVQRRVDGGTWTSVLSSTTHRYTYLTLSRGHLYEFRFAARDRAGNAGAWVMRVVDLR